MADPTDTSRSGFGRFLSELTERNITRTAAIYAVAGLAVIEFADVVFPLFGIGEGIERVVILAVLAGFPVALVIAWWFELGPDGIRRRPRTTGLLRFAAGTFALAILAAALVGVALRGRIAGTGEVETAAPPVPDTVLVTDTVLVEPEPTETVAEAPELRIREPAAWSDGADEAVVIPGGGRVGLEGVARHAVPITEVLLNGRRLRLSRAADGAVGFSGTLRPEDARFGDVVVVVRVADGGVHFASYPARVEGAAVPGTSRGPEIEIFSPTEWAGAGTRTHTARPTQSIRVEGLARAQEGIREVRLNNRRMALARSPDNPSIAQFSGFVEPPDPGSEAEVELLVVSVNGSRTVRTFTASSREPERPQQMERVASAAMRQRWAVIVGISDYQDGTIADLQYADDDARAVYEFLRSPAAGMGGFPESNIRLLVNEDATSRNLRSALTTFLRQSTPNDVVFLYFAAHGAPDPYRPDDLYILTHNTRIDDIAATAVSMEDINGAVQDAYAYNKILFADVGHSAGVGMGSRSLSANPINVAFTEYMGSPHGGFVAFTASEANQLSQEGEQWGGGHGVFTYYLLQGLRGAADLPTNGGDGDRIVTLGEVIEYTRDRVRRATRNAQIPTISLTSYDRYWPMAAAIP